MLFLVVFIYIVYTGTAAHTQNTPTMEDNAKVLCYIPSPIFCSSPKHIADHSNQQNLDAEIEFEECINRNMALEREVADNKNRMAHMEREIHQMKKNSTQQLPVIPTDDVIFLCQSRACNDAGCFVRHMLRYIYPTCTLGDLSLSGRDGRNKIPKFVVDFIFEQCKKCYPKSNGKKIMKTFSSMFVNERRRLKKLQERLS
jgi:hypothetical protein